MKVFIPMVQAILTKYKCSTNEWYN